MKAAQQEQDKLPSKPKPTKSGTLKLPKKPADPSRVQDVAKRINDKYGHVPNKRALN